MSTSQPTVTITYTSITCSMKYHDLTAHFLFARDQNTKTGSIDGKLFIHEGSVVHNVQMKGKEKGTTRGTPLHSSQIATFLIRTTCFLGKRRK